MIIPVRCFTCGKPIAHLWSKFKQRVEQGEDPGKVLDDLELKRYCCRAVFIGHIDLLGIVSKFKKF
jgi:DNA-directed RNA polymerase subunit N